MAARFWVGGSGTWSTTNTTNWSATSGGAGGASVPISSDDVTIDGNSGSPTVTTNYGASVGFLTITSTSATLSLGESLTCSGTLNVTAGTFTTNNNNVTASQLASSNTNARTINLGSSTVTLNGGGGLIFTTSTNLTFNAGTSQITCSATNLSFGGGGQTFYNVSFTNASPNTTVVISGANSFNNLTVAGITSAGLKTFTFSANQTISGTLTVSAGTNATMRNFLRSDAGTSVRTLTCAAASLTDVDFRAITLAGAAAPASGTRLGDCKANSGITFGAGVTRYWNSAGGGNWSSTAWAASSGGAPATNNFPLAQDTALFEAPGLNSGATVTLDIAYNIGTINMSARTSNTMTLATGGLFFSLYGNWVNGTGTSISGNGIIFFNGTNSAQTITSAGKTFTQAFSISGGATGSVTLQDDLRVNNSVYGGITLGSGTLDANGFNVTLSGEGMQATSGTDNRTLAIGSGTWTVASSGSGAWNTGGTGFSVTGTGTISMTSFSDKTFTGNSVAYTGITLNQGGGGNLNITGSNTFANITNTYASSGPTTITLQSGSTNTVSNFTASGQAGRQLTITRSASTPATLSKASGVVSVNFCTIVGITATGGATWEALTINDNINGGGNTGWIFGGNSSNFFMFF